MNYKHTWEQISKAESGTIFLDKFDEDIRFIIMKGGSSLCGYVGLPIDHPLSGFDYDDMPVSAHGGLTFSGDSDRLPNTCYWYGWDYAHAGDYCDYYDKYNNLPGLSNMGKSGDKKWLPEDVEADSWNTIYEFKKLMKLAEKNTGRFFNTQCLTPSPFNPITKMNTEGKEAAYPIVLPHSEADYCKGLTKREYFAALNMQAIVSSIDSEDNYVRLRRHAEREGLKVSDWIARDAVKQADALIAALNQNQKP